MIHVWFVLLQRKNIYLFILIIIWPVIYLIQFIVMFGVLIKHLLLLVSFFSFFSHFCGWLLTLHLGFLNEKKIWCFRCCSTIFFALLENQYSTSIKQFHSGNAPKYSLLNFSWLKEWFTNFLMLPVRSKILLLRGKHQHLLNVARCSFFTVSDSGSHPFMGRMCSHGLFSY